LEIFKLIFTEEMAYKSAKVLDRAALIGIGADNEPLGILNTPGVNLVVISDPNGGDPTRDTLIEMEGAIAEDNADIGELAFLLNNKTRSKLKRTLVDPGSGRFVWTIDEPEELIGYRALTSTQVPSNLTKGAGTDLSAGFFGYWRSLMLGQWGGLDILINPFSKDNQGIIRVNMSTFYDVGIMHPQSFAIFKDAVTV